MVQGMAVCLALGSMEDLHAGSAIGVHLLSRKRGCELETPEAGDNGRESPRVQRVVRPRLAETWFRPLEVAAMNAEPATPQDEVPARVDRHGDVNLLGNPSRPTQRSRGWVHSFFTDDHLTRLGTARNCGDGSLLRLKLSSRGELLHSILPRLTPSFRS